MEMYLITAYETIKCVYQVEAENAETARDRYWDKSGYEQISWEEVDCEIEEVEQQS